MTHRMYIRRTPWWLIAAFVFAGFTAGFGAGIGTEQWAAKRYGPPGSDLGPEGRSGGRTVVQVDGSHLVGTDVMSGLYFTPGARDSGVCRWFVREVDGTPSLASMGTSSGQQYARLIDGLVFDTEGCQPWTRTG